MRLRCCMFGVSWKEGFLSVKDMCKLIVLRVSDQGARFEVSFFSFQRVCACVVVFGEGVLTPTLNPAVAMAWR